MIYKHEKYKNGYIFAPSSTDSDLQKILKGYNKVNCVICSAKTAQSFRISGGKSFITINNNITDGCFFINSTC